MGGRRTAPWIKKEIKGLEIRDICLIIRQISLLSEPFGGVWRSPSVLGAVDKLSRRS